MANFIKTGCSDCCPCASHCVCEDIGFRVGFVIGSDSDPERDPDASLCCTAYRPAFWWAEPPSSITSQLEAGETLVYEVWAEDASVLESSCLRCEGDGTPEYRPNDCDLYRKVLEEMDPEATRQPAPGGGITVGPFATREEWYGSPDADGCCRRWPNFFVKAVARNGASNRTLAVCNALWGGIQGDELCSAVEETGDNPCPCGVFEECKDCPENDGIDTVSLTFTPSEGDPFGPGTLTRSGSFTGGCDCPGGSWSASFGWCSINHTAVLCLARDGTYYLSVFVNQGGASDDDGFSGSGEGGACGAPSIETFGWSVGVLSLCSFDVGVTITADVSFTSL